jgi:hypothetical protein
MNSADPEMAQPRSSDGPPDLRPVEGLCWKTQFERMNEIFGRGWWARGYVTSGTAPASTGRSSPSICRRCSTPPMNSRRLPGRSVQRHATKPRRVESHLEFATPDPQSASEARQNKLHQVSTQGRLRPARPGGCGAERRPRMIQARVSIGSMTWSISSTEAMLIAFPVS